MESFPSTLIWILIDELFFLFPFYICIINSHLGQTINKVIIIFFFSLLFPVFKTKNFNEQLKTQNTHKILKTVFTFMSHQNVLLKKYSKSLISEIIGVKKMSNHYEGSPSYFDMVENKQISCFPKEEVNNQVGGTPQVPRGIVKLISSPLGNRIIISCIKLIIKD